MILKAEQCETVIQNHYTFRIIINAMEFPGKKKTQKCNNKKNNKICFYLFLSISDIQKENNQTI